MGFSFRVAPGAPIRASSLAGESVQVSGRGRPVFISALAGRSYLPVRDRFRPTGQLIIAVIGGAEPTRTSMAACGGQPKRAARAQQARELSEAFEAIANVHRMGFAVAAARVGPSPAPADQAATRRRHRQVALHGVGAVKRAALTEIGTRIAEREEQCANQRRGLDEQSQRLLANDPDDIFTTLPDAFEDNEPAAVAVGMHGGGVAIVVHAPDIDVMPGGTRLLSASVLVTWTCYPLARPGSVWPSQPRGNGAATVSVKPVAEGVR